MGRSCQAMKGNVIPGTIDGRATEFLPSSFIEHATPFPFERLSNCSGALSSHLQEVQEHASPPKTYSRQRLRRPVRSFRAEHSLPVERKPPENIEDQPPLPTPFLNEGAPGGRDGCRGGRGHPAQPDIFGGEVGDRRVRRFRHGSLPGKRVSTGDALHIRFPLFLASTVPIV